MDGLMRETRGGSETWGTWMARRGGRVDGSKREARGWLKEGARGWLEEGGAWMARKGRHVDGSKRGHVDGSKGEARGWLEEGCMWMARRGGHVDGSKRGARGWLEEGGAWMAEGRGQAHIHTGQVAAHPNPAPWNAFQSDAYSDVKRVSSASTTSRGGGLTGQGYRRRRGGPAAAPAVSHWGCGRIARGKGRGELAGSWSSGRKSEKKREKGGEGWGPSRRAWQQDSLLDTRALYGWMCGLKLRIVQNEPVEAARRVECAGESCAARRMSGWKLRHGAECVGRSCTARII
eukprot:364289-Chlamydomonas_euryale.AAC.2